MSHTDPSASKLASDASVSTIMLLSSTRQALPVSAGRYSIVQFSPVGAAQYSHFRRTAPS